MRQKLSSKYTWLWSLAARLFLLAKNKLSLSLFPEFIWQRKNLARGGAFGESQNGSIGSGLTPTAKITHSKILSRGSERNQDRGPAESRAPEMLVSTQLPNHSRLTGGGLYQQNSSLATASNKKRGLSLFLSSLQQRKNLARGEVFGESQNG